jgi:hypothetical protein
LCVKEAFDLSVYGGYVCVGEEVDYGLHVLMPIKVSFPNAFFPGQGGLFGKVRVVLPEETEKATRCLPAQRVFAAIVEGHFVMVEAKIAIDKCFFDALFKSDQTACVQLFLKSGEKLQIQDIKYVFSVDFEGGKHVVCLSEEFAVDQLFCFADLLADRFFVCGLIDVILCFLDLLLKVILLLNL